ncbi:MAG: preprotein translocase subunit SecG [Clostridiales bacterium]|nr:preprotein translocase subunit SecG [Clostridiales bacterium]
MTALQIAFSIVLCLLAIVIIVLVLMQEGTQAGLGAISGGSSESFFSGNKSRTNEAKVKKVTKILVIAFCILVLAATVVLLFTNK